MGSREEGQLEGMRVRATDQSAFGLSDGLKVSSESLSWAEGLKAFSQVLSCADKLVAFSQALS